MVKWMGVFALSLVAAGAVAATVPAQRAPTKLSPAQLLARADQPWLPASDDWKDSLVNPRTRGACQSVTTLPIPAADLPPPAALPALAKCDSMALAIGDSGHADPVRARQCAYLERAGANDTVFGGSAMLSVLYANGEGVPRNLPLATKFACEAGGAPAEVDGRVAHLVEMDMKDSSEKFRFCDDITSGYMMGFCAGAEANHADATRHAELAELTRGFTPPQQAAWSALNQAATVYFSAHSDHEVDQSGSGRGAFVIEDEQASADALLASLKALVAGKVPAGNAQAADARLNAVYRRVLANPDLKPLADDAQYTGMGTITAAGIRADQRTWIPYRDAWEKLGAALHPDLAPGSVAAWITTARTDDLRSLLPSTDPDYRASDN